MKFTIPLFLALAAVQFATAASYTNDSDITVAGNSSPNSNVAQSDSNPDTHASVEKPAPPSVPQGDTTAPNTTEGSSVAPFHIMHGQQITLTAAASADPMVSGANSKSQIAAIHALVLIPEPSAALLGGLGMICLFRRRH